MVTLRCGSTGPASKDCKSARFGRPPDYARGSFVDGRRFQVDGSRAVAVVTLAQTGTEKSKLNGFIPTGQYPAAIAVVGRTLLVGNGKGTGVENSSVVVNNSGRRPTRRTTVSRRVAATEGSSSQTIILTRVFAAIRAWATGLMSFGAMSPTWKPDGSTACRT
jgi:hypothetical protein